jgi:hypothetical protein
MKNKNTKVLAVLGLLTAGMVVVGSAPKSAQAGDWSFSIGVPFHQYYVQPPCYHHYPVGWDYYPVYNPVLDRDVYRDGYIDYRGNAHSNQTVEDRHASYYSPGRNEAITEPVTSVDRSYGPGYARERERTSWIGSDGLPHSTTINRTTTRDPWGNTHTDTGVTLKSKGGASNDNSGRVQNQPAPQVDRNPNQSQFEKPAPVPSKKQ